MKEENHETEDHDPAMMGREISDSVNRAIENYSKLYTKTFEIQLQSLAEAIKPKLEEMLAPFNEAIERATREEEAAAEEIGPALRDSGFWISASSPASLIGEIRRALSNGTSDTEAVRETILSKYRSNDFEHLKHLVESCSSHQYFKQRSDVIQAALRAHAKANYALSIPALLPLLEGALIIHFGKRFGRGQGGTAAMAEQAANDAYIDIMRAATSDAFIDYVTGVGVYGFVDPEYFHPDKFEKWLISKGYDPLQVLNRHAILHGVQVNYASEENSLRSFLLIDVLTLIPD